MRTILFAILALSACAFFVPKGLAADDKPVKETPKDGFTGILIDNHCAAGMMSKDDPEAAAAKHPKACATKEACEKEGYGLIVGKKHYTFNAEGNKLAKEWLAKTDKTDNLRVTVTGTAKGDDMSVHAITAPVAPK